MVSKKLNVNNIENKLRELGFNQASLAEKLNVSREAVSQWLKNKKYPRPRKLLTLSEILGLPYNELILKDIVAEPQVAYRTRRNRKITDEMTQKAKDMGEMLAYLVPYFPHESLFSPEVLEKPSVDSAYIQKIALLMREELGIFEDRVGFESLVKAFKDKRAVIIPVLWGNKGDCGLHIRLPKENINFVYVNVDSLITDFKFWLLHELAHLVAPDIEPEAADDFADTFAGAFLFPFKLAADYYNKWKTIKSPGIIIEEIKRVAEDLLISPITIYTETNRYAVENNEPPFSFPIHPANENFIKTVDTVTTVLFDGKVPTPKQFVDSTSDVFQTNFFKSLSVYLKDKDKGPGMIQRIMDIPFLDAKGVYDALAN